MGIQPDKNDVDLGPDQPPQEPPARSGVAGALVVAAIVGAVLGGAIALFFAPDLLVGAAIGGALSVSAIRVFILMSSDRRGLAPMNDKDGTMQ